MRGGPPPSPLQPSRASRCALKLLNVIFFIFLHHTPTHFWASISTLWRAASVATALAGCGSTLHALPSMSFPGNGKWVPAAAYTSAMAAALGRTQAEVGRLRVGGATVTKDEEEGVAWLRSAAVAGDAGAQFELGRCHDEGIGVEQDARTAVRWYAAAAQRAHPQATCTLGYCYAKGHGVGRDEAAAAKLFLRAAQLKLPEGQYNLGVCHAKGRGVPQDFGRAVELYRKAAAQGHGDAMCNLAHCLEKGQVRMAEFKYVVSMSMPLWLQFCARGRKCVCTRAFLIQTS